MSIYDDFVAHKNTMSHGKNVSRIVSKYNVSLNDVASLAIITFKIPDLSDAAKRAQLPPSQHKNTAGLLLQGCAQNGDPLAIAHILTAVYLGGSGHTSAQEIARLFPKQEIAQYRQSLDAINLQSLEKDPGLVLEISTLRGLFLEQAGQKQEARKAYQQVITTAALKYQPGQSAHAMKLPLIAPWNALGDLLKADKDPKVQAEAKFYFQKGALEGDDPLSYYELAAFEPRTSEKWLQYTSKAAASGHEQAILNLTNFYQEVASADSPILKSDSIRKALNWVLTWKRGSTAALAREWQQVASVIGHKPSMLQLADYYDSIGSPSNFWSHSSKDGFDLTHPSIHSSPVSGPTHVIQTSTEPITIDPSKSALVIIDMQNFFLSEAFGRDQKGPGHAACEQLVTHAIPAARKAGIRVIWVNWGLTEEEVESMPPAVKRAFGFFSIPADAYFKADDAFGHHDESVSVDRHGKQNQSYYRGIGADCGTLKFPDGKVVQGGRLLMRDSWNAALQPPLDAIFTEGSKLESKPDVWIHKNRMSGMWGATTPLKEFLDKEGIRTLFFTGVNTDQCVGGLRILVPVKRVIDYAVKPRVNRAQTAVETANVKHSMNPFDELSIEEAVRMREKKAHHANAPNVEEIVAFSAGVAKSQDILRTAMAMGADRGIHVVVEEKDALEPLGVAKLLRKVVDEQKSNLVILGKQAIDDDAGQTGQMLAGLLNWPQATQASKVTINDQTVEVVQEVDGGVQTIKAKLPMVITTDLRLNEPRYASLPNIMKAKKKKLDKKSLSDYGLDTEIRLKTVKVTEPPPRKGGVKVEDVDGMISKLKELGAL
ncbi:hypothetical protein ACET3X_005127 [Alternaria dauci]|uniref:Electron transfer flavoprotein alpha/beta-subunit N-terminal domain-containing protein n=1 Tax=Alternaria dauci TaxID=48095 RepID=A0ABR3UK03_9PLEO